MHHGAGSSGLSFATCTEEIRKILPKAGVLSLDARSHGRTVMTPIDGETDDKAPSTATAAHIEASGLVELDLSLETLSRDLVYVIRQTQARMGWEILPDIVLVGHSLGGAVITDVAKNGELGPKLLAYAVLDVVEGTFHSHHLLVYTDQVTQDPQWTLSKAWKCTSQHDQPGSHHYHQGLNGSMRPQF